MNVFPHRSGHIHYALRRPAPDAPVLVFANSLGTDLRVWDAMLAALPGGWGALRYDKPGHGLSELTGAATIADHADLLSDLMDHAQIGSAVIVGLSVGGMIAQSLAARHPAKVRALVLMDTGHKIGAEDLWNARIEAVRNQGIAAISDGILARWFSAGFREANPAFALWRMMLTRTSAEGYAAVCAAIRDADLTEGARALRAPTLCIAGSEDGSTPPALVRELAGLIAGARYAEVVGAGHLPCVENPAQTAGLIADFITEAGLGG